MQGYRRTQNSQAGAERVRPFPVIVQHQFRLSPFNFT